MISWRVATLDSVETVYGTRYVRKIWKTLSPVSWPARIAGPWLIATRMVPTMRDIIRARRTVAGCAASLNQVLRFTGARIKRRRFRSKLHFPLNQRIPPLSSLRYLRKFHEATVRARLNRKAWKRAPSVCSGSVGSTRAILGFRGELEEWERLLGAAARRN